MAYRTLQHIFNVEFDGGRQSVACRVEYVVTDWTMKLSDGFVKRVSDCLNVRKDEFNRISDLQEANAKLKKDIENILRRACADFCGLILVKLEML